ncbi:MAG: DHA2 family efflux MFS transporter permease subunit [Terriglobia bacterium]|jgi:DHA2 family multidrug resistance protein
MTVPPQVAQGTQPTVTVRAASLAERPWLITAAVMLATFMEVLDTTVVNVSLTHIAGSLSATPNEATWALTSYLVANGIVIPISGWLANHFGRKNLLLFSTAGFTVASLLCGIAPSMGLLVTFRVIQGACGGSLQPLSQAVLLEAFPREQHGKAMAVFALGVIVAPVLGPVLGGWLTDNYSWRWVFYINLPVGLISVLMIKAFVKDPPYIRRSSAPVDSWGLATLVIWVAALQIMLDKGQEEDWFGSRFIVVLAVAFVVGLLAWVTRELNTRDPVAELRVFRQVPFAAGTIVMALQGFVMYGSQVTISIWLQTLMGYPSVQAGLATFAMGLGAALSMPVASFLVSRFDPRKVFVGGILISSFSFYRLMGFNLEIGFWDVFWPQFIQGLSLGLVFVPLTVLTMAFIPKERMGNATSLFNMMRNIGGGVGISIVETMLTRMGQEHTNLLVANITPVSPSVLSLLGGLRGLFAGSGPVLADQQAYAALFGLVQREATMVALVRIFQYLGVLVLTLIPLIALTKRPPKGQSGTIAPH